MLDIQFWIRSSLYIYQNYSHHIVLYLYKINYTKRILTKMFQENAYYGMEIYSYVYIIKFVYFTLFV